MVLPLELIQYITSFINPKGLSIDQRLALGIVPLRLTPRERDELDLQVLLRHLFVRHHRLPTREACPAASYIVLYLHHSDCIYRRSSIFFFWDAQHNFLGKKEMPYYVSGFVMREFPHHCLLCTPEG